MIILAHRGWWTNPGEKNSRVAVERAFAGGFGIETDIRDLDGELVVAHDMPRRGTDLMTLTDLLGLHARFGGRLPLALNVKSDGLAPALHQALLARDISNYFVFDMSVPDTLGYLALGMRVFTRRSEFEQGSSLDRRAQGLWLDALEAPHVPASLFQLAINEVDAVALVSPELHRKPHSGAWASWRGVSAGLPASRKDAVMLCTDFPDEARAFFS